MAGEFNVRNAAMAICSAQFSWFSSNQIREGLRTFNGIARRQEVKGIEGGIRVIDDFAHHPTAIGLAIDSLRQQYPDSRLWVIFEPRSNTTRTNVFQNELANALAKADLTVIPTIPNPEKIKEENRLNPQQLMDDIKRQGTQAWYCHDVEEIVDLVAKEGKPGDTVAVLSNGGFEGIHQKLLSRLAWFPIKGDKLEENVLAWMDACEIIDIRNADAGYLVISPSFIFFFLFREKIFFTLRSSK